MHELKQVPISQICPSELNPPDGPDKAALEALTAQAERGGLVQPLLVRSGGEDAKLEVIGGARHLRAAQNAGVGEVSVVLDESLSPLEALLQKLISHRQRGDLNPIDEAEGYRALRDEHRLSQAAIARLVRCDRSVLTNALRWLELPVQVQDYLRQGLLTRSHGEALGPVRHLQEAVCQLAREAVDTKMPVPELQRRANEVKASLGANSAKRRSPARVRRSPSGVIEARLRTDVRAALDAGWDPATVVRLVSSTVEDALAEKQDGSG